MIVNISFFFVFAKCYPCVEVKHKGAHFFHVFYYAFFASTFNLGWASVQVSHMALAPELTTNEHERVRLNSARYAGGIAATLLVLGIAWYAIKIYGITEEAFRILGISSLAIGNFFTLVFFFGVKEESKTDLDSARQITRINSESSISDEETPTLLIPINWKSWFRRLMFYQVGIIYMLTRVILNYSQLLMPFYLQFYLDLKDHHKTAIAEVPLVIMVLSFATTFFLRKVNKKIGVRSSYLGGSIITLIGLGLCFS